MIASGTPGERKRIIEALICEVRITDDGNVRPVFEMPGQRTLITANDDEPVTVVTGSRNAEIGAPSGT